MTSSPFFKLDASARIWADHAVSARLVTRAPALQKLQKVRHRAHRYPGVGAPDSDDRTADEEEAEHSVLDALQSAGNQWLEMVAGFDVVAV